MIDLWTRIMDMMESDPVLTTYLATQVETQHILILEDQKQPREVELPTWSLRVLVDILAELADGNAVKVVPVHAELNTKEAADLLNVSRPHFVKLLVEGELAFHGPAETVG